MIAAALQLADYWATSLHVDANQDFDPNEPVDIPFDLLDVSHQVKCVSTSEEGETRWQVELTIEQSLKDGENIPYFFKITMQGIVIVQSTVPDDKVELRVQANGPAMLFGAAREVIRAATGRGPFSAVLIPSTNFLKTALPLLKKKAAKKSPRKKVAKKVSTKKVAKKKSSS